MAPLEPCNNARQDQDRLVPRKPLNVIGYSRRDIRNRARQKPKTMLAAEGLHLLKEKSSEKKEDEHP